jgi:hypothetical protein
MTDADRLDRDLLVKAHRLDKGPCGRLFGSLVRTSAYRANPSPESGSRHMFSSRALFSAEFTLVNIGLFMEETAGMLHVATETVTEARQELETLRPISATQCWGRGAVFALAMDHAKRIVETERRKA